MSYWGTIYENPKEQALDALREAVKHGEVIPVSDTRKEYNQTHPDEPAFLAYEYPQMPVRVLTICRTDPVEKIIEAVNGVPFLKEGEPNVFEVLTLNPDDIGSEGTVECVSKTGESITFLDPLFCYNQHEYAPGKKFEFSLAAIAYNIEWLENPEFEIDSGPTLEAERERALKDDPNADVAAITSVKFSMANMRCLIPREEPGDIEFQTAVESVEWFDFLGVKMCKMRCFLRDNEQEKWPAILYASGKVLKEFRPQIGQIVRGVALLQAWPRREIPSETLWIDRGSSKDAAMEGIMRAFAAQEYLSDLHPGVSAIARTIIAAGWDVIKYNKEDGDPQIPDFLAERGEKQINVWVQAAFSGTEKPNVLSSEEKTFLEGESKLMGQDALFVTVECKEKGDYYFFDIKDTDLMESSFGHLSIIESVRKPGTEDYMETDLD